MKVLIYPMYVVRETKGIPKEFTLKGITESNNLSKVCGPRNQA